MIEKTISTMDRELSLFTAVLDTLLFTLEELKRPSKTLSEGVEHNYFGNKGIKTRQH